MVNQNRNNNLGELLRQSRVTRRMTLCQLSIESGVSSSHLGRIERGERYPSGAVLRKLAGPLGFDEAELFTLAGYMTPTNPELAAVRLTPRDGLDPYVARVLGQEPVEVQRTVIGILSMLKSLAQGIGKGGD